MSKDKAETVAKVGRFKVKAAGGIYTLYKDGVELVTKSKREIVDNKKDWRGMVPEYTVASMLLESWLNCDDNFVNTKVGG